MELRILIVLHKASPCRLEASFHNSKLQIATALQKCPHHGSKSNMFPPSSSTSPLPTTATRTNKNHNSKTHTHTPTHTHTQTNKHTHTHKQTHTHSLTHSLTHFLVSQASAPQGSRHLPRCCHVLLQTGAQCAPLRIWWQLRVVRMLACSNCPSAAAS